MIGEAATKKQQTIKKAMPLNSPFNREQGFNKHTSDCNNNPFAISPHRNIPNKKNARPNRSSVFLQISKSKSGQPITQSFSTILRVLWGR